MAKKQKNKVPALSRFFLLGLPKGFPKDAVKDAVSIHPSIHPMVCDSCDYKLSFEVALLFSFTWHKDAVLPQVFCKASSRANVRERLEWDTMWKITGFLVPRWVWSPAVHNSRQWLYRESSGNAVFAYHKWWVKPGRPGTEKGSPCTVPVGCGRAEGQKHCWARMLRDAWVRYSTTASLGDLRSTIAHGSISVHATFFYWTLLSFCFLFIAVLGVLPCSTGCWLGNDMTSPNSCHSQRKVPKPGGTCRASAGGIEGMGSALWEC